MPINWAKSITEQEFQKNTGKETGENVNWAKSMFEGAGQVPVQAEIGGKKDTYILQTGEEPTGAIDTRTGKPITRYAPYSRDTASLAALTKQGFVDEQIDDKTADC